MLTEIRVKDNSLTAKLSGEIDHHNAVSIRSEIDFGIRKYFCGNLVLDFRKVTFMDSSGIGLILGRYKLIKGLGGIVEVYNPAPHIKRLLSLAGIERIAPIKYCEEIEDDIDSDIEYNENDDADDVENSEIVEIEENEDNE